MPRKRLNFQTYDEVIAYANALLENGYVKQGNWSLGQNCYHLSKAIRFWIKVRSRRLGALVFAIGIPRVVPYIGELMYRIGVSAPAPSTAVSKQPVDDAQGIRLMTEAIAEDKAVKQYSSNNVLQLWHCGHHLGFLRPNSEISDDNVS